jgi:ATPase subunit of ABC transporter with duplicated ATPase domains
MPVACHFSNLSVSFDGQFLFTGLAASLPPGTSGLVGPNGAGKSVLLGLLAGIRTADTGTVCWERDHYLLGQWSEPAGPRVAEALGVAALHDCIQRIELGRGSAADLDRVADLWQLPALWRQQLDAAGLAGSDLDTPLARLSGGQRKRLALCAAFRHPDHYLLLDEPGNHLDSAGRDWLQQQLAAHPGGALVASHDRDLLRRVDVLFELRGSELRSYGGGYELYRAAREAETAALAQRIEAREKQLRRSKQHYQASQQRAASRRQQGRRQRRDGSQGKMLLDAKTQQAQQSAARQRAQFEQRQQRSGADLQSLKARLPSTASQQLVLARTGLRGGLSLHLEQLQLPRVTQPPVSLTLHSGDRCRLMGPNGAGKSTLLQVIAGQLTARSGRCETHGRCLYLDQHFSLLAPDLSATTNLQRLHPGTNPEFWRTRLGSLRLRGDKALLPVAALSGGERLKVALLAVTAAEPAPELLLLDEPDNHLDLDSRELLATALRDYPGTLLVVSHDEDFVAALQLDQSLALPGY